MDLPDYFRTAQCHQLHGTALQREEIFELEYAVVIMFTGPSIVSMDLPDYSGTA